MNKTEIEQELLAIDRELVTLDANQHALKVLLNSLYGVLSNKHSALMDIDLAASVTETGQAVVQAGSSIVDAFVSKQYGIDASPISLTKYNDTDSIYISISPILNKLNAALAIDNIITSEAYTVTSAIDTHLNTEILNWARQDLYSINPSFVFKREAIADVGVFLMKKRYILHVLDDEGESVDKFKYVGMEVARSSTPKPVKELIKSTINAALLSRDHKASNEIFRKSYDKFITLSPQDLAKRQSANNYEKYAAGATIAKYNSRTPGHVRGAINFNLLLKQLGVEGKYESIQSGQKVKIIYVADNRYGITSLAFLSEIPKEFEIKVDYKKMFDIMVTGPVQKVYEAVGWRLPEIGKEVQTDLFELLGD